MLLSVSTLVIANIIEEEESALFDETECSPTNHHKEKQMAGKCRKDLISCLQLLGDYESLLAPPQPIIILANQAAAKAAMFLSGLTVGSGNYECVSVNDLPMNCCK